MQTGFKELYFRELPQQLEIEHQQAFTKITRCIVLANWLWSRDVIMTGHGCNPGSLFYMTDIESFFVEQTHFLRITQNIRLVPS